MDKIKSTEKAYEFLWARNKDICPMEYWHFNKMQEIICEPIIRGRMGIEVGSGCGYDTYIMAKNGASVKIVSTDISDGVYATKRLTSGMRNVYIFKSSALDIPLKDNLFDFAYSFGVLHHTVNPIKSLSEIARVLKKDSPAFIYLYEKHSGHIVKYIAVMLIKWLRIITVRIHPKALYLLSWAFSPLVFIIFSVPSIILRKFRASAHLAEKIPFNFGTGLFSLRGDLYDRFAAPVEYRFSREEVYDMFLNCGFRNINIAKLNDIAGWVAWGYKNK